MDMNTPEAALTQHAPMLGGLVTYLSVSDAAAASEFYQRAFGAAEQLRMGEPGQIMHLHLHVNGSSLMLSDPFPQHGHPHRDPAGYTLHLMVDSADAGFKRAVEAGATEVMAPHDAFWGDRYAQVRDPFGVDWAFVSRLG